MIKKIIFGIVVLLYVTTTIFTFVKINGISKKIQYSKFTKEKAEQACDKLCIALADDMFSDTKGKFTFQLDDKQETSLVSSDTIAYKKGDTVIVFTKLMLIYLIEHENHVYFTIGSRLIANIELQRGKQYGWLTDPTVRYDIQLKDITNK
jgi:hypothetical protein